MNQDSIEKIVSDISPEQVCKYLNCSGWTNESNIGNVATIWHRSEKKHRSVEIVLPLSRSVKDYINRMVDVILTLSEFEKRPAESVAKSLANLCADLISIRVVHQDVKSGTIPLNDGLTLIEKAKELLVSSAKSTLSKQKIFHGKSSEEVTEYLKALHLGQTEVGSYVINIVAPIETNYPEQSDWDKKSFSRLVSSNLAQSLSAIQSSISAFRNSRTHSEFDDAVNRGVSANLCEALIGLSGSNKNRLVSISIDLSPIEEINPNLILEHTFVPENVIYLEEATKYFNDNYVIPNFVVDGYVSGLKREKDTQTGVVTVTAKVNGQERHISFDLDDHDYMKAIDEHEYKKNITCTGDLHLTTKTAKLMNCQGFGVFSNTDIFNDRLDDK
jgi:hypothetical protein